MQMPLLSDTVQRKFVDVVDLDDEWEIESDEGWSPISKVMKTVEYEIYKLQLENGLFLECADKHIVFRADGSQAFVEDLLPGDLVKTKEGDSPVVSVQATGVWENMYDVEVNTESHSYFSNGILSHNTTVMAGYLLWYAIFHKSKRVAVLANKGDQAQEIMDRIRLMFEYLPFFLQLGVEVYNKTSLVFENKSKIFSAATSSSSIRGQSCVTGDSMVTVRDKETGKVTDLAVALLAGRKSYTELGAYEVLTPEGFKPFKGIARTEKDDLVRFTTQTGRALECTYDHQVFLNGEWAMAISAFEGDSIRTAGGDEVISKIEHHVGGGQVYDLIGVEDTESYYTNGVLSHNCDAVYIDEAAFIERDMEFYESTYPVISSGSNSKVIMTTTPKGARGMFYTLWKGAEANANTYSRLIVKWNEHPKRDEEWARITRDNITEPRFRQEYEVEFKGSSGTLIPGTTLDLLHPTVPLNDDEDFSIFKMPEEGHKYVAVVDCSEGVGQDYSVVTVVDVSKKPYEVVARYRSNTISPLLLPHTAVSICKRYNEALCLIEGNNDVGGQVSYITFYELEYENTITTSRDEKGMELKIGGRGAMPGVKTTRKVKGMGCATLKTLLENDMLILNDDVMINELGTFIAVGTSYEADKGCHDDTVMTLVLFSWFINTDFFKGEYSSDVREDVYANHVARIMDTLSPLGVMPFEENDPAAEQVEVVGGMKVTVGFDLARWMTS